MTQNYPKKISIVVSVLIAFLIAFFTLYFFLDINSGEIKEWENEFYSRDFHEQKKILILGSSHTGHINATYVNQYLERNQEGYAVYNLSIMGDRPQQRLGSVDKIISINPELVIYGVGFRDFKDDEFRSTDNEYENTSVLPDPQEFIRQIIRLDLLSGYDLNFFQSPKAITLKTLHHITQPRNMLKKLFVEDTPFFHPSPKDIQINVRNSSDAKNLERLDILKQFSVMNPPEKNIDALALKLIAKKLYEHDVKLVIFSTPYNKVYFELVPEIYESNLNMILDELNNDNVKVYKLHNKYEDSNIWTDHNHIALDPKITIFNDDIIKIILEEVN